jgi:chemotaxis protein histidine kinase CheA
MKLFGLITTGVLLLLLGITAPAYQLQEQKDNEDKPSKQEQQAKPEKRKQQDKQQQQRPQQQEQQQQDRPQQQKVPQQQDQNNQQQKAQQQQQDQNKRQQQRAQEQQDQQKQQQQKAQQQQDQNNQQQKTQQQQQDQNKRQEQRAQQQRDQQKQQELKAAQQQAQQRAQQQQQEQAKAQRVQQSQQQGLWQQHRASNWEAEHRTWQQRGGYSGYRIPDADFRSYSGQSHGFRIYSRPTVIVGGSPRFQYGGYWFGPVDPWPGSWSNNWYQSDDVYIDYSNDGYYLYNRSHPGIGIALIAFLNYVLQDEQRQVWLQHRAHRWRSEHRTWQQRGGYDGYRIPDDDFWGYFGPDHGFRLYDLPLAVVGKRPRFQYGGYWFSLVDPWPEYWSDNWYENDDVYVDYSNDGYYLYNRRHPDARIAISVFLG